MSYLAKYLPDFGWSATVLTRQFPKQWLAPFPVFRAPELHRPSHNFYDANVKVDPRRRSKIIQSAFTIGKSILQFPDATVGWMPGALSYGLRLTQRHHFDAIISSLMPPTVHVVASILSKFRRLPWVADFRDPWLEGRYSEFGPIRKRFDQLLERLVIGQASVLTTVSPSIAELLNSRHNQPTVVINNSFDVDDWASIPQPPPTEFRICYAGTLYDGQRSPETLFRAVQRLRAAGEPAGTRVKFSFYGRDSIVAANVANQLGIADSMDAYGVTERQTVLHAERNAACLLILLSRDPRTHDETGSKVFEYMGSGRPIIAVGPKESVVRGLIARSGLGWFGNDEEDCVAILRAAYARYARGEFVAEPASGFVLPTARRLAESFANVLNNAVASKRSTMSF